MNSTALDKQRQSVFGDERAKALFAAGCTGAVVTLRHGHYNAAAYCFTLGALLAGLIVLARWLFGQPAQATT